MKRDHHDAIAPSCDGVQGGVLKRVSLRLVLEWIVFIAVVVLLMMAVRGKFSGTVLRGSVLEPYQGYGWGYEGCVYTYGYSVNTSAAGSCSTTAVYYESSTVADLGSSVALIAANAELSAYPFDDFGFHWEVDGRTSVCLAVRGSAAFVVGQPNCVAISSLTVLNPQFVAERPGVYALNLFLEDGARNYLIGRYVVEVRTPLEDIADFNNDGQYTFADFLVLLQSWNSFPATEAQETDTNPYSVTKVLTKILEGLGR